jgi:hypothetical protein
MRVTIFALLTAASVCLGMITFSVNAKRTQDALNAIPDRAAMMSIEPAATPTTGQPG